MSSIWILIIISSGAIHSVEFGSDSYDTPIAERRAKEACENARTVVNNTRRVHHTVCVPKRVP